MGEGADDESGVLGNPDEEDEKRRLQKVEAVRQ